MDKMDIKKYKENPKTSFLAGEYDRVSMEEEKVRKMSENDPQMEALVEEEATGLAKQKNNLLKQMSEIVKEDEKEEHASSRIKQIIAKKNSTLKISSCPSWRCP